VLGVPGEDSGEGPRRVGEALPAPDPEAALHDCGERPGWVDCGPSPCRTNQFADPTPQVIADRGPS